MNWGRPAAVVRRKPLTERPAAGFTEPPPWGFPYGSTWALSRVRRGPVPCLVAFQPTLAHAARAPSRCSSPPPRQVSLAWPFGAWHPTSQWHAPSLRGGGTPHEHCSCALLAPQGTPGRRARLPCSLSHADSARARVLCASDARPPQELLRWPILPCTRTRARAHTQVRTHARTHARTHTRTHTYARCRAPSRTPARGERHGRAGASASSWFAPFAADTQAP
jgi:hypothetical protein